MKTMPPKPKPKGPLGKQLYAIRVKRGADQPLTQEQAGALIHVSRNTWRSWETGKAKPQPAHLMLIKMLEDGTL